MQSERIGEELRENMKRSGGEKTGRRGKKRKERRRLRK